MPVPIEQDCLATILNLTMQFGGLTAKAQDKDNPTWDQDRIDSMYERLMDTAKTCRMAERCIPAVRELHSGLNALMDLDTVDTSKRSNQISNITQPLMNYISCLFTNYELQSEANLDGKLEPEDYPDEDSDWIRTILPHPQRITRDK